MGWRDTFYVWKKNKRKNQRMVGEENEQSSAKTGRRRRAAEKVWKRGAGVKTWGMSRLVEEKDRKGRVGS